MPDVTIGICAYNEVANIGKSVKTAIAQKLDGFTLDGVTVVCSGASSAVVQERVTKAVQAVLHLAASRICVVPAA